MSLKDKLKSVIKVRKSFYMMKYLDKKLGNKKLSYKPIYLHIEPTNLCNFNCITCSRKEIKNKGYMTFDNYKKIFDQMPKLLCVKLQGMGEPLLNPDLEKIVRYTKSKGTKVFIETNGSLLNKDNIKWIVECIDLLSISIDGSTKKIFESTRKGSNFDNVIKNVKQLMKEKSKSNIDIIFGCVMNKYNEYDIFNIIRLIKEIGGHQLYITLMIDWNGRYDNSFGNTETRIFNIYFTEEFIRCGKKNGIDVIVSPSKDFRFEYKDCMWYNQQCYITWDGYVTPCCSRPNPDQFNFGNIFKEGFDKIWNNKEYQDFRSCFINGKAPKICYRCPQKVYSEIINKDDN